MLDKVKSFVAAHWWNITKAALVAAGGAMVIDAEAAGLITHKMAGVINVLFGGGALSLKAPFRQ